MKTFIWADNYYRFSEYQFYVAQAENVDEARKLLKKQLQSDHLAEIKKIYDDIKLSEPLERCIKSEIEDYTEIIIGIYQNEPSHIITDNVAMCIEHANP